MKTIYIETERLDDQILMCDTMAEINENFEEIANLLSEIMDAAINDDAIRFEEISE